MLDASGLTDAAISLTANGGDGDDVLIGGAGNDTLTGGAEGTTRAERVGRVRTSSMEGQATTS